MKTGVKDKNALAKEAVGTIQIAKKDNSEIEMIGMPDLKITTNVIKEAPEIYEPPTPEEKIEKYTDVTLLIFASDKDNINKGWAGIAPGIIDNRIKITLAEDIDPSRLHGNTQIQADINVISKYLKKKEKYQPTSISVERYM